MPRAMKTAPVMALKDIAVQSVHVRGFDQNRAARAQRFTDSSHHAQRVSDVLDDIEHENKIEFSVRSELFDPLRVKDMPLFFRFPPQGFVEIQNKSLTRSRLRLANPVQHPAVPASDVQD